MASRSSLMKIGNAFIKMLLRSPFHPMLSGNMMLVTVKGKKSGKPYTTPVNYVQDGDEIRVVSQCDRTWWRNLRGGADTHLLLRGREVQAKGEVVEDQKGVAEQLSLYLAKIPKMARYFGVSLTQDGQLNRDDLFKASSGRVFIIFKLKG